MITRHEYRGFVFTIEAGPDDPTYFGVDFPDITGIITSGPSFTQAFANACEALDLYLETVRKHGDPLPPARHRLVVEAGALS